MWITWVKAVGSSSAVAGEAPSGRDSARTSPSRSSAPAHKGSAHATTSAPASTMLRPQALANSTLHGGSERARTGSGQGGRRHPRTGTTALGRGVTASPSRTRRRTRSAGRPVFWLPDPPAVVPSQPHERASGVVRRPSPVTATGSRRLCTGFPQPTRSAPSSWRAPRGGSPMQPPRASCPRLLRGTPSTANRLSGLCTPQPRGPQTRAS